MYEAPISGPSCPSTIRLRWREYIWSSAEPQTQSEVTWQNMVQCLATLQNTKVQYSSFTVKALLAQCTSRASTRRVYFISIIFWVQYINHNNNTYFIYMQTSIYYVYVCDMPSLPITLHIVSLPATIVHATVGPNILSCRALTPPVLTATARLEDESLPHSP